MSSRRSSRHTARAVARGARNPLVLAALLYAFSGAVPLVSAPAAQARARGGGEGAGSRYPTEHGRRVHPGEFVRSGSAAAHSGSTVGSAAAHSGSTGSAAERASSSSTLGSGGAPNGGGQTGGVSAGGAAPAKAPGASSRKSTKKPTKKKPKPGLHGNPARALVAYDAMQENFYIPGTGLYEGEPYSYLWSFSQALAATVSVSDIPGQTASAASTYSREFSSRLFGLQKYWGTGGEAIAGEQPEESEAPSSSESSEAPGVAPPALPSYSGNVEPPGGASYYDDNEWVGIELMRLYQKRHEASLLERTEQIMQFVMAGWSTNPKLACPGGVPFSDAPSNTDRNTVTNGPGAELALLLYGQTHNASYLQFALQAYEWVRNCLRAPNELYYDHIRLHGAVEQAEWSYNQGSMIGAGTMLYQATGNSGYLYQARQTAKAALEHFTLPLLLSENPFFVAVYFRNLMYLDSVTHDPPGAKLAQSYIDSVWVHQRLSNDLFAFGSPPSTQLLYQASVAQIYALLSTSPSTYF